MIRAHAVQVVRDSEAEARTLLPDGELMARAAQGLAAVAAARLHDRDDATVVGLVGSGDNGGDTLYAVALLAEAGFPCAVVLVPSAGRDGVDERGLETAEANGVLVHVLADDPEGCHRVAGEGDLVLDGIVGIGGRPGLRAAASALVDAVADDAWLIAVDLASGIDPEGRVAVDDCIWADETVTFATPKPGHLLPAGERQTGVLTVVDIGVAFDNVPAAVERLTWDDVARLWPRPTVDDDKYSRGVLGVVAGSEAYPGAAVLCTTAAAEAGVGMIRYVGTPTPTSLVHQAVPEAVVGPGRVQAWAVGPGLDADAAIDEGREQVRLAREALASDLPVVVDAGGLDLVDGPRDAPTVLTPHAGELARLLNRLDPQGVRSLRSALRRDPDAAAPDSPTDEPAAPGDGAGDDPPGGEPGGDLGDDDRLTADDIRVNPLGYTEWLQAAVGATVLLKGSTTLVVTTNRATRSQADAPTWLATAGAGDVLTGVIGTLLAAGLDPHDAASLGALVHGVAADKVAEGGPLRALAVAHGIRPAVRDLLARGRSAPE